MLHLQDFVGSNSAQIFWLQNWTRYFLDFLAKSRSFLFHQRASLVCFVFRQEKRFASLNCHLFPKDSF